MDLFLAIGLICVGAVLGGLIVYAWMSDRALLSDFEPTEHGGTPL
ncbi:hypothetical protein [Bradyrhizobium sp. BRP22]|nr:hypothetical protein [Bradyrhizobium sp. BRP22]